MSGIMRRSVTTLFVCFVAIGFRAVALAETASPVAVITGSSFGLGNELARMAAEKGWRLALIDNQPAQSAILAQSIKEAGGEAIVLVADLSKGEERKGLIEQVVSTYGRVDYLFNNAGYAYLATIEQMELKPAHRLFEVNYWAYVDLAQQAIAPMRQQGGGVIVNVSSILATVPAGPGYGHYSATKYALHGVFQSMMQEVAADGIKVFLAAPGGMKTKIGQHALGPLAQPGAPLPDHWEDPSVVAADIFAAIDGDSGIILPGYVGRQQSP